MSALCVTLIALRIDFDMAQILYRYLVTMARSIEFCINFNRCVRAVLIAGIVPAIIIQVVADACDISVRFFRRFSVLRRAFREGSVATIQIRFIAINSFRRCQLSISRCLSTFRLGLTRSCFGKSCFCCIITIFRYDNRHMRVEHFNDPFDQIKSK